MDRPRRPLIVAPDSSDNDILLKLDIHVCSSTFESPTALKLGISQPVTLSSSISMFQGHHIRALQVLRYLI